MSHDLEWLWFNIRLDVAAYKNVCDSLTHPDIELPEDEKYEKFTKVLSKYIDLYGIYSLQVQTLMKMIVEVELPAWEVRKAYKNSPGLAPAFNSSLVARPDASFEQCFAITSFMSQAWQFSDSSQYREKHPNTYKLICLMQKHFRKYMSSLRPRVYVLTNGSSTCMQDHYNICDINGIVYMTDEEEQAIKTRWNKIISFFKILNFDKDLLFVTAGSRDYYGTINVAPDDSGKTRISYCIDSVVQVISKAVSKCLDYVARKFPSNCTMDQMRIIRNILQKKWNKEAYIMSLDMSKYSDTAQFSNLGKLMLLMGIPEEVVVQLRDLYTLPMLDVVKGVITPRTEASYQGQYGDFSLITLLNIFTQTCIYDYLGEEYILEEKDRDECNGGAVGDDTIMVFFREHPDLFRVVQCFYNQLGVAINRTKTHTLFLGVGTADFIKRFITSDGLVPYLRLDPFTRPSQNEWVEEVLRFQRSNLLSESNFREICNILLPEEYAEFCCSLHPLNGGVIDRPITEDDLRMFVFRDSQLSYMYSLRNEDELRKWTRMMHERGIKLCDTALIGFAPHHEEFFETSEIDDDDDCYWTQDNAHELEQSVEDAMLGTFTHGYEKASISGLSRVIGLTYAQLKEYAPQIREYIDDYNHSEIYRYMQSQTKRRKRLDVYDRMMSADLSQIDDFDSSFRSPRTTDYSSAGRAHNISLAKQCLQIIERNCHRHGWHIAWDTCWQTDREYMYRFGEERRLYSLKRVTDRSRDLLTLEEFDQIVRPFMHEDCDIESMYGNFIRFLPGLERW